MKNRPEDNAGDGGGNDGQSIDIGNPSGGIGAGLDDGVTEASEGIWEAAHDKIRNAEEDAADDKEGNETHAKDTAEVLKKSFAMTEEEDGTLAGGFGGLNIATIENPAETAVAKIGDDGINDSADGAANGATRIAADSFADGGETTTELVEDTLNDTGNGEVSSDSSEALFYNFFTGADDIIGELIFSDGLGHHGDLAGLVSIRDVAKQNIRDDAADESADGEAD